MSIGHLRFEIYPQTHVADNRVASRSRVGEEEGVELELDDGSVRLSRSAEGEVNNCDRAAIEDVKRIRAVADGAFVRNELGAGDGRHRRQLSVNGVTNGRRINA